MTSNGYQATVMAHILTSFFSPPQQIAVMNHACSKEFHFDGTVCFMS